MSSEPKGRVWMHKKTGQLYEQFQSFMGGVIAWEDLTTPEQRHKPIKDDSPLQFEDVYNANHFEDLGEL